VSHPERFLLILRSETSSVPTAVRLRLAVKVLLRVFHLRVEEFEPLPQEQCLPVSPTDSRLTGGGGAKP
jgi:hypothetical protein